MIRGFRDFLVRQNFLALALAVVIGTAVGKVVSALVADLIMPVVGLVLPGDGGWRQSKLVMAREMVDGKTVEHALLLGDFLGAVVDFLIVAWVVYLVTRAILRTPPPSDTRSCPYCKEEILAAATRCKFCTAEVEPGTAPAS